MLIDNESRKGEVKQGAVTRDYSLVAYEEFKTSPFSFSGRLRIEGTGGTISSGERIRGEA